MQVLCFSSDVSWIESLAQENTLPNVEFIKGDSTQFIKTNLEKLQILAVIFKDLDHAFIENFRATWQGWFTKFFHIQETSTTVSEALFCGCATWPNDVRKWNQALQHRVQMWPSFMQAIQNIEHSYIKSDPEILRQAVHALLLFDESIDRFIVRILIGFLRSGQADMARPMIDRLLRVDKNNKEFQILSLVRSLEGDSKSESLFTQANVQDVYERSLFGHLHGNDRKEEGEHADVVQALLGDNWGIKLSSYLFERLTEYSLHLPEDQWRETLIRIEELHKIQLQKLQERRAEDVFVKKSRFDPDLTLLENVKEFDLQKVVHVVHEQHPRSSGKPKKNETPIWVVYHPGIVLLEEQEQIFTECKTKHFIFTSKLPEVLYCREVFDVEGMLFLDGANPQLLCEGFMGVAHQRHRTLPAIGVLYLLEQSRRENFWQNLNVYQDDFPKKAEGMPRVLDKLLERKNDPSFWLTRLNTARNFYRLGEGSFFRHMSRHVPADVLQTYHDLEKIVELREVCFWDQVCIYIIQNEESRWREALEEVTRSHGRLWNYLQSECFARIHQPALALSLDQMVDKFWTLEDKNPYFAYQFGMFLVAAQGVHFLGAFLSYWQRKEMWLYDGGYFFLSYQYYKSFGEEGLMMQSLYQAVACRPESHLFLTALIDELDDSLNHTELQLLLERAMQNDFVDIVGCKIKLARSYFNTKKFKQGDELLLEILKKDFTHKEARLLAEQYGRQALLQDMKSSP